MTRFDWNRNQVIHPGRGLEAVKIGDDIGDVVKRLGEPQGRSRSRGTLDYVWLGFEVAHSEGLVESIFFHFRSRLHAAFSGRTVEGIGFHSTTPDVLMAYDEPSGTGTPKMTRAGEFWIEYARKGIRFTFRRHELEFIRVFRPLRSQEPSRT